MQIPFRRGLNLVNGVRFVHDPRVVRIDVAAERIGFDVFRVSHTLNAFARQCRAGNGYRRYSHNRFISTRTCGKHYR
jgi:hypothetical protein